MTAAACNLQPEKPHALLDRVALLSVSRAISDLRRGWPAVILSNGKQALLASAPDTMEKELVTPFSAFTRQPDYLLLTAVRARHLGIGKGDGPVRLPIEKLEWEQIRACFDPLAQFKKASALPAPLPSQPLDQAALFLVKQSGLLPALLVSDLEPGQMATAENRYGASSVEEANVRRYPELLAGALGEISRAAVPLMGAPGIPVEVATFRAPGDMVEHVAILVGMESRVLGRESGNSSTRDSRLSTLDSSPVIRLHSSCFTGDIIGSLRCDCGDQLRLAIAEIAKAGGGAILYLNQEGRGIGIANKLRAYRLQDGGMDTVEANEELGFEADERSFHLAAAMLKSLGMTKIKLLTNNPAKVDALRSLGIDITERLPLVTPTRPENAKYLDTKAHKCGHVL